MQSMSLRFYIVFIVFWVRLLIMCGSVMAQDSLQPSKLQTPADSNLLPKPILMTLGQVLPEDPQIKINLVKVLDFARFSEGTFSANTLRLKCVVSACDRKGSKHPTQCFDELEIDDKQLADKLICRMIASPTQENIKIFQNAFPDIQEADLMEGLALTQAIKGNAAVCQKIVKESYGKKPVGSDLLIAMSGCRILSKKRTSQQEEDDYLIWHNVASKRNKCSDIKNFEIREACRTKVHAP